MKLEEGYLVARAVMRVMRDSNRTDEIHLVEELTGRSRYRRLLERQREHPDVALLLRERPELDDAHIDFDDLRALSADTLGGRYVRHLDDNGLTASSQAVGTRFIEDDDMAYLMRRFRQTHDVWHALLGLGIEGHEEVIVHAFSWGQLRLPVSAMVIAGGTLKHFVLERRWRALRYALLEAYRIGRDARPLLPVYWERLWHQPIDIVRDRLGLQPCNPAWVHG